MASEGVRRATWRTLKADVVVGADTAVGLFLVNAPEALFQTGVDHLPSVGRCHPVRGASLHGHGPRTNPLPVIETDRFQALIVSVASRVVDVEPGCPLCHTCRQNMRKAKYNTEKMWQISPKARNDSTRDSKARQGEKIGTYTRVFNTVGQSYESG